MAGILNDDEIEIIYWGEDEEDTTVNADRYKKKKKRSWIPEDFDWKTEAKGLVKLVVAAVVFAFILNEIILINASVPTGSMEQTIHAKSRMMGLRLTYMFTDPERGDIIIFENPDNRDEKYVKRVIALPGEYVEIRRGVVYINDMELPESYKYFDNGTIDLKGDFGKTLVPQDSYFVLGDNRNQSKDSRFWETTHYVHRDLILGEALFSYYPKIYWLK